MKLMADPQFEKIVRPPLDKHLSVRLTADVNDAFEALCSRKGMDKGDAVREALTAWYKLHKNDPPMNTRDRVTK
jgi:hypothetical protein